MPSGFSTDEPLFYEAPQRIYFRKQEFRPQTPSDVFTFSLKPGYVADLQIWGNPPPEEAYLGFKPWSDTAHQFDGEYTYGDAVETFVAYGEASRPLTACNNGRSYDMGVFKFPVIGSGERTSENPYGTPGESILNFYAPQNYCPTDGQYAGSMMPFWMLWGKMNAVHRHLAFSYLPQSGPFDFTNLEGTGKVGNTYGGSITLARIEIIAVPDNNTLEYGNPAVYRAGYCSFGRI